MSKTKTKIPRTDLVRKTIVSAEPSPKTLTESQTTTEESGTSTASTVTNSSVDLTSTVSRMTRPLYEDDTRTTTESSSTSLDRRIYPKASIAEQLPGSKIIAKHYEDKLAASTEKYQRAGAKVSGLSQGYVGRNEEKPYMLKPGRVDTVKEEGNNTISTPYSEKRDLVSEYLTSDLYKRMLYDRAPTIGLAREEEGRAQANLYLKSIFHDNFEPLNNYLKKDYFKEYEFKYKPAKKPFKEGEVGLSFKEGKLCWQVDGQEPKPFKFNDNAIADAEQHRDLENIKKAKGPFKEPFFYKEFGANYPDLLAKDPDFQKYRTDLQTKHAKDEIKGFEKVVAVSSFLGEVDYHGENFGVVTNGKEKHVVKIDHGRSGWGFLDSEEKTMKKIRDKIRAFEYQEIPFEVEPFKTAISEINKVSKYEIKTLIAKRSDHLKSEGLKLNSHYGFLGSTEAEHHVELGSKIRFNANLESEPLKEHEVALSMEDGKIICQTKGKQPITIEKSSDGKKLFLLQEGVKEEIPDMKVETFDKMSDAIGKSAFTSVEAKEAKESLLNFTSKIGYTENEQNLRYQMLEAHLVDKLYKQKEVFKEISKTLDIVSKIDAGPEWKKGQWMQDIYTDQGKKDPIAWARENGKTIEGKNPDVWLREQEAVTKLQKLARGFIARKDLKGLKEQEAATKLQKLARGFIVRKDSKGSHLH